MSSQFSQSGILIGVLIGALVIVAATIAIAVVVTQVRKKKSEPFRSLKAELDLNGALNAVPVKGYEGNQVRTPTKYLQDDDIKTISLFDDSSAGLCSYYIELQDVKSGKKHTAGISDRIKFGRYPDCDIVVESGTVSGYHCEVLIVSGRLILRDLNSLNGTFINGMRVVGDVRLTSGILLRMGQKEYLVTVNDFQNHTEQEDET